MIKRILLTCIALLIATNAIAATYFIKTGGNDGLDGLSDGNAWETVGKVSGFTFSAADTISFNKGDTWADAILTINNSGTSGNRIVVGAYGTGADPIFQGGIQISQADYVTLQDIETQGNNTFNTLLISGSQNVNITDIVVDGKNNATQTVGIRVQRHSGTLRQWANIVIDGVEVFDCGDPNVRSGGGILVASSGSGIEVKNSDVYDNVDDNILSSCNDAGQVNTGVWIHDNDVYNDVALITNDNYASGINLGFRTNGAIAEHNVITNCRVGFIFDALTETTNIGRSNKIVNSKDQYVLFLANANGNCRNHKWLNNTHVSTNGYVQGIDMTIIAGALNNGHILKNNIQRTTSASFRHIDADNTTADFTSDYNDFHSTGGDENFVVDGTTYTSLALYQAGESQDANSIDTDPSFGANYVLNAGSPCIGTGETLSDVPDDFRSGGRSDPYDMGAMLYGKVIRDCVIKDAVIN